MTKKNAITPLAPPDGVPLDAWLRIARADGARWAIAERDASGEVTGTAYRDANGGKTWAEPKQISAKGINAAYPRVVAVSGSYRVFWTESITGQPGAWKSASLL